MAIEKIKITNFKCFKETFTLELNQGLNILVGKNEVGKSTILEAIHLALTGYHNGKSIRHELSQYIFNIDTVKEYISSVQKGNCKTTPPSIVIEIFYNGSNGNPEFEGNKNSENVTETCGFTLSIELDEKYQDSYEVLIREKGSNLSSLPLEYYTVKWETFARKYVTPREIKLFSSLIDSSRNNHKNISDSYVTRIIKNNLEENERVTLAQAHRELSTQFAQNEGIQALNKKINKTDNITDDVVTLGIDLGSKSTWENTLIALANDIPFSLMGKGTQCILKTELSLSSKEHERAGIVLIEEPECHLTHSYLQKLVQYISQHSQGKQIIISTHSSYVTNKLGLENVIMLRDKEWITLNQLPIDTASFFKKVTGYDTLRYILCSKAILVEGPSDDLVIQKAYYEKHGCYPADNGIDIISVGTSFGRFLDIASHLPILTHIVTDNDGKPELLKIKYGKYSTHTNIKAFFEETSRNLPNDLIPVLGEKFNYNTLEPLILKENGESTLNSIFGTSHNTANLLLFMKENKTDCALKIFLHTGSLKFPNYIQQAIEI